MKSIQIADREVQEFTTPFIIAEAGINFNGDLALAKTMILQAKRAGVDLVKFQSWSKDTLMTKRLYEGKDAEFQFSGHKSQGDFLDFLSLSKNAQRELKTFCDTNKILFTSTPVSEEDVDFLDEIGVPCFKIASMDLNHLCLLRHVAKKGKPVILSTGMGSLEEIERAVEVIHGCDNDKLILLHCTALYPPFDDEVNLNNIDLFRERFSCMIGYSDHTLGIEIPLAATVKGVAVIEKHLTLDKNMEGWDHAVSATPEEFKSIVHGAQKISKALGSHQRVVTAREMEKRGLFRRSIVARRSLGKGKQIGLDDLAFKRPGTGISPDALDKVINKKVARDIKADEILSSEDLI